jgi:hypothetical protein
MIDAQTINDPKFKVFLTKALNDYGLDINQKIDMNDPMTKMVMTVVITNIEQGRDIYNYDQFIKGCAASIGIDPATFDQEINPTTLGFENNSGPSGYVPPTLPSVLRGGSTIPLNISTYVQAGIAVTKASGLYDGFGLSPFNNGGTIAAGAATVAGAAGSINVNATPFSGSQGEFYNTMYSKIYSQAVAANAPNPTVIAQLGAALAAQETAYGAKSSNNNVFNITGTGNAGSVVRGDLDANGQPITHKFAAYTDLDSASAAYVKLMSTAPRYAQVWNAKDITSAANALGTSGYAADPRYGASVLAIASKAQVSVIASPLGGDTTEIAGSRTPIAGKDGTVIGYTTQVKNSDGTVVTLTTINGVTRDNNGKIVSDGNTLSTGVWEKPPPASALGLSGDWKGPPVYGPDGKFQSQTFIDPNDPTKYVTVGATGKILTDTTGKFSSIGVDAVAATPPQTALASAPQPGALGLPDGTTITTNQTTYTTAADGFTKVATFNKAEYTTPDGKVYTLGSDGKLVDNNSGNIVGTYSGPVNKTGVFSSPLPGNESPTKVPDILAPIDPQSAKAMIIENNKTIESLKYSKDSAEVSFAAGGGDNASIQALQDKIDSLSAQNTVLQRNISAVDSTVRDSGTPSATIVGINEAPVASSQDMNQMLLDRRNEIGIQSQDILDARAGLIGQIGALSGPNATASQIAERTALTEQLVANTKTFDGLKAELSVINKKLDDPNYTPTAKEVSAIQDSINYNDKIAFDQAQAGQSNVSAVYNVDQSRATLEIVGSKPAVDSPTPLAPNPSLAPNPDSLAAPTNNMPLNAASIDSLSSRIENRQSEIERLSSLPDYDQTVQGQINQLKSDNAIDQQAITNIQTRQDILSPNYQEPGFSTVSDSYALNPLPSRNADTIIADQTSTASSSFSMSSFNQSETNMLGNAPMPEPRPAGLDPRPLEQGNYNYTTAEQYAKDVEAAQFVEPSQSPSTAIQPNGAGNLPVFAQGDTFVGPVEPNTTGGFGISGIQSTSVSADGAATVSQVASVPGSTSAAGATSAASPGAAPAAGAPPGVPSGC